MRNTFVSCVTTCAALAVLAYGSGAEQAAPATWPTSKEGLVFAFESGHFKTPPVAFRKDGRPNEAYQMPARLTARFDRNFAMVPFGGSFVAEGAHDYVAAQCAKTGALTVEAYLTPAAQTAKDGQSGDIIALGKDHDGANFVLVQDKDKLVFSLLAGGDKKPSTLELCKLDGASPVHLIVTYENDALACYVNGKPVELKGSPKGDLKPWATDGPLTFGDNAAGGRPWLGTIEGIALYSRALTAEEAKAESDAWLKKVSARKAPAVLRIVGKLVARSDVPQAKHIQPYFQALAVYEYEVEKVLEGKYDDKKIRVATWAMMEKRILPIATRPIGKSYELTLELSSENRQLESQWLSDTLEQALDLKLYYDVSPQRDDEKPTGK